jgi:hypothetical protein
LTPDTIAFTISNNQNPVVTWANSSITIDLGQTATFAASASDPDGPVPAAVSYFLDDAVTAFATAVPGTNISLALLAVGTYSIRAVAQDSFGGTGSATLSLTVQTVTDHVNTVSDS